MWKRLRALLGNIIPIAVAILCVGTVIVTFVVVYNDRRELIRTNQALIEQVKSTGEVPVVDSPSEVVRGDAGTPGATGPAGPRGEKGERGLMGERGQVGPQGPPGEDGADGAQGGAGPKGEAGTSGKDGSPGANGATGPIGPQGPAGPKGDPGANGANGTNGADSTVPGPAGVGIVSITCNGDVLTVETSDGMSKSFFLGTTCAPAS